MDATGHWTISLVLGPGTFGLTATQSPAPGIVSAASEPVVVTVLKG